MIFRRLLHIEWHRGRRPRLSLRRLPQAGDVVWNGDVLCVLDRCDPCGEGFMARELSPRVERREGRPSRVLRGRVVRPRVAHLPATGEGYARFYGRVGARPCADGGVT